MFLVAEVDRDEMIEEEAVRLLLHGERMGRIHRGAKIDLLVPEQHHLILPEVLAR